MQILHLLRRFYHLPFANAEQRSSHGSASLGSGANAAGAAMNSPNVSHNSAPSVPVSLPSYHAPLEANSLVELLGGSQQSNGPPSYDRSLSGREPGKHSCVFTCCSMYMSQQTTSMGHSNGATSYRTSLSGRKPGKHGCAFTCSYSIIKQQNFVGNVSFWRIFGAACSLHPTHEILEQLTSLRDCCCLVLNS